MFLSRLLILVFVIIPPAQANSFLSSFLSYLSGNESLAPSAMSCNSSGELINSCIHMNCNSSDELINSCIQEICGGQRRQTVPLLISGDEMESFISNQLIPVPSAKLVTNAAFVDAHIKSLASQFEELSKIPPEEIKNQLSETVKRNMITNHYFYNKCIKLISPKMPIDQRVELSCEDDFADSPIKAEMTSAFVAHLRRDLGFGLNRGFYSFTEVETLVPQKLTEVAARFREIVEEKSMDGDFITFMQTNWNSFQSLNYGDKIRFIQGLDRIGSGGEQPQYCHSQACLQLFDHLIQPAQLREHIANSLALISSPEFRNTALASLEVQSALEINAPTAEEMTAFNSMKSQTIRDMISYQEKIMSPESLREYTAKINEVSINYDEDQFSTEVINLADNPPEELSLDRILGLVDSPDYVFYWQVGAEEGPVVFLLTDMYQDQIQLSSGDDFGRPVINISLHTVKNLDVGRFTLAHELGHHLSYLHNSGELSENTNNKISAAKACIASRYDDFNSRTGQDGGQFFLEEEFADEVQLTLSTASSPLTFCPALLNPVAGMEPRLEIVLGDDHQNPLWRTLIQSIYLGRDLPDSCQQLIVKSENLYQYQKCL